MKPQLKYKNEAMGQLQLMKGSGPSRELREKYTPDNVAKAKVFRISNHDNVQQKALSFTTQEKRTIWYAILISAAVIGLLIWTIKRGYIKL